MKLATYLDGSRDGQLVVVSRDLSMAHYAAGIVNHLQQALDDWNFVSPQLQGLFEALNQGKAKHAFAFDPRRCMAPLPRACLWAKGFAYSNETPLAHPPPHAFRHALQYGPSDFFWGPFENMAFQADDSELDFAAGLAVITGDIPPATLANQALEGVRLVMLVNEVGAATAFSPVAVSPDELGAAWQQGRVNLTLQTTLNGRKFGLCDTGPDMRVHFGELLAQLAAHRPVRAGAVVGTGAVANPGVIDAQGRIQWPKGHHSIADKRAAETQQDGQPTTPFLKGGDSVVVDMKDLQGQSLFGAIEIRLVAPP
jgi:fumarylacetoacetate (FAA) hydrolase